MAYIDREKVLKAVEKMDRLDKETKTKFEYDKEGFLLLIKSAPTEDVVEVKHGEWKQTKEPLGWQEVDCVECSSCGESWIIDEDLDFEEYTQVWKYCLNCGAKMDLEEE